MATVQIRTLFIWELTCKLSTKVQLCDILQSTDSVFKAFLKLHAHLVFQTTFFKL